MQKIKQAAEFFRQAKHIIAFTGAGISVESGIPTFRGQGGVWEETNPQILELDFFMTSPEKSWPAIRDKFFQYYGKVKPNKAHLALTELQKLGLLKTIITQNIDHLHQDSGSVDVQEFHGTLHSLSCVRCGTSFKALDIDMSELPFCTACSLEDNFLKPDFIFFGEGIPEKAFNNSFKAAQDADLCLVVGTSGLVNPAANIPHHAKETGAKIIEINLETSAYTNQITDISIEGKAGEMLTTLVEEIKLL